MNAKHDFKEAVSKIQNLNPSAIGGNSGEIPVRSRHCKRFAVNDANWSQTLLRKTVKNHQPGRENPKEINMSQNASSVLEPTIYVTVPHPIPFNKLAPWVIFGGLLMMLLIYFVGAEEGATSIISGMYVHEWVHDGRHLLGFPCH